MQGYLLPIDEDNLVSESMTYQGRGDDWEILRAARPLQEDESTTQSSNQHDGHVMKAFTI